MFDAGPYSYIFTTYLILEVIAGIFGDLASQEHVGESQEPELLFLSFFSELLILGIASLNVIKSFMERELRLSELKSFFCEFAQSCLVANGQ